MQWMILSLQLQLQFPKHCDKQVTFPSWILRGAHTERQRQRQRQRLIQVNGDAWEWVWDPFSSGTMHSNETLPLPLGVFIPLILLKMLQILRTYLPKSIGFSNLFTGI